MPPALTQVARVIVTHEIGGEVDADRVAAGVERACKLLAHHLARLVGEAGIRALVERSLTLSRVQYPWLPGARTGTSDPPWTTLRSALQAQPPDAALEGSVVLVATLLGLLGRLIGERLVLRLVLEVWPQADSARGPEETS